MRDALETGSAHRPGTPSPSFRRYPELTGTSTVLVVTIDWRPMVGGGPHVLTSCDTSPVPEQWFREPPEYPRSGAISLGWSVITKYPISRCFPSAIRFCKCLSCPLIPRLFATLLLLRCHCRFVLEHQSSSLGNVIGFPSSCTLLGSKRNTQLLRSR